MSRSTLLRVIALLSITLLAYVPAINGGFIWDDDDYVTENPTLGSLSGLKSIWLPSLRILLRLTLRCVSMLSLF